MSEKELEEIVVNRGDSKDNYWIYKVGEKKKYDYQDIYDQKYYTNSKTENNSNNNTKVNGEKKTTTQYYNHNLMNPNFVQNLNKAADRIRLQYAKIEEF